MLKSPVILLAFANADPQQPLDLKEESSILKDALLLLEHEGLVNVEREESVTLRELEKRLLNFADDLVIFHYAGHASSMQLFFEEGTVAGAGIARILGLAPHLQLVFLNACSTRSQATAFLSAGVKMVIATSAPINDDKAVRFSRSFYEAISRKKTIEIAFRHAVASVEAEAVAGSQGMIRVFRGVEMDPEEEEEQAEECLWRIYYQEENHLTWKIDINVKIMFNLRGGSQIFFDKLLQGPLIHHQKLIEEQEKDFQDFSRQVTITWEKDERKFALPQVLMELWKEDNPHVWLYGGPGAGKTGSVLLVWNYLLNEGKTQRNAPVPLFVDIEEYTEGEDGYLLSFLSRYYLELEGYSESNEQTAIEDIFSHSLEDMETGKRPSVVLFLDGNLHSGTTLFHEIARLARLPGLQIVCTTSNPEIEATLQLGFQTLRIEPLDETEIKEKIQAELQNFRPEIGQLVQSNRLWLSLFHELSDKIQATAEASQTSQYQEYAFIPDFTTEGEFLWNYFEARLFSLTSNIVEPDSKRSRLHFYRFYLRHFIPLLAYRIEREEIRELAETELLEHINEISRHFYQPWFLRVFPEYRRDFKNFLLQAPDWVEESERLAVVIELCKDFSIFIEGFKTYAVNQPGRELPYLQKVRTYQLSNSYFLQFLAAAHIWQEIKASLYQGDLPLSLRENELSPEVQTMLGQIDALHRSNDASVLLRLLERCRGIFDQKTLGKTVWNILHIWHSLKGHYMGLSLAKLDLRGIPLFRLSKELSYEPFFLSSELSYALVNYQDIFYQKGGYVVSFAYGQWGTSIVTGETKGTIRIWDTELNICYKIIEAHASRINSLCLSEQDQYIISGGEDETIKIWDPHTERCLLEIGCESHLDGPSGPLMSVAYHAIPGAPLDRFWLLSSSTDKKIFLWEVDLAAAVPQASIVQTLNNEGLFHRDAVKSVDLHVDETGGMYVIAGSWDNTVSFWVGEPGQLELRAILDRHVSRVHCVRFSPDGQYFASGSSDDTLILWKTENPNQLYRRIKGHNRGVESLQFKQEKDDFRLVSAASDDKITIWDLAAISWEPNSPSDLSPESVPHWSLPLRYSMQVNCVAFDPGSNQIAYATADARLRIWDLSEEGVFQQKAILYNLYELHVQGCKFFNLHKMSNLFEKENTFVEEGEGEKEVTKAILLRQYGAILDETDRKNWDKIVLKIKGS